MKLPQYHVDAFTHRLFAGNPAAVVLCDTQLSDELMQSIAAENNLSETAFVMKDHDRHHIRWFTPTVEVDLCGHATLAAAHVIFHHLGFTGDRLSFDSKSGLLHVRLDDNILFLDFPTDTLTPIDPPEVLTRALGTVLIEAYKGRDDVLVVVADEASVASLAPKMELLSEVDSRGICVTAPGDRVDFVSRFFAPQSGVPEDPVTGSAHTTLIPYWSERLGKTRLHARQISLRGGDLVCRHLGERVEIGGQAVTFLVGEVVL
jgi:PhzF family phenazine biosynthesis protein